MRKPKNELAWYAYEYEDFNGGKDGRDKLKSTNVIRDELIEDIMKLVRTNKKKGITTTYSDIKEKVRSNLMWHYWSKCEYEFFISGLFSKVDSDFVKVSVWDQVAPNMDILVQYIINGLKITADDNYDETK